MDWKNFESSEDPSPPAKPNADNNNSGRMSQNVARQDYSAQFQTLPRMSGNLKQLEHPTPGKENAVSLLWSDLDDHGRISDLLAVFGPILVFYSKKKSSK